MKFPSLARWPASLEVAARRRGVNDTFPPRLEGWGVLGGQGKLVHTSVGMGRSAGVDDEIPST
jgi:hypothetical protein